MRRLPAVFLLFALLLTGCASVHTVDPTGAEGRTYAHVNAKSSGNLVHIALADGQQMKGFSFRATADTSSWIDPATNRFASVPTHAIREVTVYKPLRGAAEGLGAALGVGLVGGITRALIQGDDPAGTPLALTMEEKMVAYSIAMGAYSSAVTIPVGAFRKKNTYRFELSPVPADADKPTVAGRVDD